MPCSVGALDLSCVRFCRNYIVSVASGKAMSFVAGASNGAPLDEFITHQNMVWSSLGY
ncbi:hypothetical protein PROFUN_06483 [Planoprotostelium fungivorum]|uniref:Uncharacterized protein n=1 Tax=Planoprotostelium fungivorum TaxID=1890364 RepID=A0A2P6NNW1_9EUKA|nr:hypothetical protein PROFUN_06483 [Planoprotostelium fungivorum]